MRRFITLFICALSVATLSSCDIFDTDLDQINPEEPTTETYFQNLEQLETAVFGIYDPIQGLYRRSYYFAHDLLANDAYGTGSLIRDLIPLNDRVHDAGNSILADHWEAYYQSIKNANVVITQIQEGVEGVSESDLNRLEAEARFLRAWNYYELVTKYGDVPLITDVKQEIGGEPVSPEEEVYNQVLADLEFARNNLPLRSEIGQLGRVPRGAAHALEGEVYLFLGSRSGSAEDWESARQAFQAVIDLGEYRLMDNYFANFRDESEFENNAESLFEIQYQDDPNRPVSSVRRQEYGMLDWRNTLPHPQIMQEYEDEDPRKGMTVYEHCDTYNNGETVKISSDNLCGLSEAEAEGMPRLQDDRPDWRKYESYYRTDNTTDTDDGFNLRVIRYAEVLAGLAEAQIELGNITSSGNGSPSAIDLLNQIRSRPSIDMPPYPTPEYPFNSYDQAIAALYHEYAVEFAGEQVFYPAQLRSIESDRRPNYLERRTESVPLYPNRSSYNGEMTQNQTDRIRRYWPIPQSEIDSNPEITQADQNPGY